MVSFCSSTNPFQIVFFHLLISMFDFYFTPFISVFVGQTLLQACYKTHTYLSPLLNSAESRSWAKTKVTTQLMAKRRLIRRFEFLKRRNIKL